VARYVWISERQLRAVKRAIKDAEKRQPLHGQSVERERDRFAEEKRADADALKELVESIDVVAGLSPMDDAADAALERSRKRDQEKKRHETRSEGKGREE
jgi:hypothetical protein